MRAKIRVDCCHYDRHKKQNYRSLHNSRCKTKRKIYGQCVWDCFACGVVFMSSIRLKIYWHFLMLFKHFVFLNRFRFIRCNTLCVCVCICVYVTATSPKEIHSHQFQAIATRTDTEKKTEKNHSNDSTDDLFILLLWCWLHTTYILPTLLASIWGI